MDNLAGKLIMKDKTRTEYPQKRTTSGESDEFQKKATIDGVPYL